MAQADACTELVIVGSGLEAHFNVAAIGCAQMQRVESLIEKKRWIFSKYSDSMQDLPFLLNPEPDKCINGYWMPTLMAADVNFDRESLILELKSTGIDARVFFWPLSSLKVFDSSQCYNAVSNECSKRGLNLPSFHDMTVEDFSRVVSSIRKHYYINNK